MSKRRQMFFFALLMAAILVTGVGAQVQQSRVHGIVKDENGQPMAGAYILFRNPDTGSSRDVKTDKNGKYDLLMAGGENYEVILKKDKKDSEALFTKKKIMISRDPSQETEVSFDLQAERAKGMGIGAGTGELTAEQKKQMAERQAKKAEAEAENKKRGNLNQLLSQARAQAATGNNEQAVATMKQATEAGGTFALIWGQLAQFQIDQSKKSSDRAARAQVAGDAVTSAKKALEICTSDAKQQGCAPVDQARYHSILAKGYALSGQMKPAGDEYQAAAQADPANAAQYYFGYGADLTNTGKPDEANDAFTKAIAADPKFADAYLEKGRNLLSKGTVDTKTGATSYPPEAAEDLKKYLELQPDGPHAPEAKAILEAMGQKVETSFKSQKKK